MQNLKLVQPGDSEEISVTQGRRVVLGLLIVLLPWVWERFVQFSISSEWLSNEENVACSLLDYSRG